MTEAMNRANDKLRQLCQDNPIGYVVVTTAIGFVVMKALHRICD
jgi:hypothetical protein